jgi:hypothetical protein
LVNLPLAALLDLDLREVTSGYDLVRLLGARVEHAELCVDD